MATDSDQTSSKISSGTATDEGMSLSAVLGATIGNMLEFYDFVTYSFFAFCCHSQPLAPASSRGRSAPS
jgi:hypothetical protein